MLEHIKTKVCPHCESMPVMESRSENTHVNGHKWETRSFACGYGVTHVPNYIDANGEHEKFIGECIRSEEFKKRYRARTAMAKKIKALIKPMTDTDPLFVERLERELNYIAGDS